jgi:flagellar protein FlaG
MHPPNVPPSVKLENAADYRENYANSVQLRASLWDFLLMFGTVRQQTQEAVVIQNFQGVYLSPQQAKALLNVLSTNVQQYEATFGEIRLEPQGDTNLVQ